jgi:Tfp pilus assembly protein PilN
MNLVLTGSSQSNARVSAYLQQLESNDLFRQPELDFVKSSAKPASATEPYDFSIRVKLRPANSEDDGYDDPAEDGGAQ